MTGACVEERYRDTNQADDSLQSLNSNARFLVRVETALSLLAVFSIL